MKVRENKNRFRAQSYNEMNLRLPSLSVNEGMARSAVAAFCAQQNPSATELADIKCAVSEAVTNCIVHAYKERIDTVYITVAIFDNRVVKITVRDKGCGIDDVKKAMEPLYTTAGGERAGLGFAVMQSFMDNIRVSSKVGKGTCVTMQKKISRRFGFNG